MKVFWAVILLLVLATAALFVGNEYRQREKAAERTEQVRAAEDADHRRATAELTANESTTPQPPKTHDSDARLSNTVTEAHAREAFVTPVPATGATPKPLAQKQQEASEPLAAPTEPSKAPAGTTKPETPLVAPTLAPAKIGDYDVMGAPLIDRTEDGALVFGDVTIKGEGTEASPYVVPWDALISAEEYFDPSRGSLRIPEHVAMLHDRWVRLDGYVSFPLMTNQPKELLAMLNMWDGCCIGVPPTPYDAVEVHLKKALTGDERFSVSGRVIGRFSVKPYVVKSWLVGMYVMEDAEFAPSEDGEGT